MQIAGLVPLSTGDWPGQLSAVLFCQGCAWRCLYCHNPHLQKCFDASGLSWREIKEFLQKRVGLLDAVIFSGGEPTLQNELGQCMDEVKDLGFLTGLHTAGLNPRGLEKVLSVTDWVALDIKAPPSLYDSVTQVNGSGLAPFESLSLIQKSGIAHEVRTTVHPAFLGETEQLELAELLVSLGVKNYALQQHRNLGCSRKLPEASLDAQVIARCAQLFETFTAR